MSEIYFCSRLRIFEWLTTHGLSPVGIIPDRTNDKYSCWLFQRTPEFESALNAYRVKRKDEQQERN